MRAIRRFLAFNLSIKNKLFLLIFVLLAYSTLVTGYFGYKGYAQKFEDKMVSYSRDSSGEIIAQLNNNIENINSFSQQILSSEFIYDTYLKFILTDNLDNIEERNLKITLEQYLRSILLSRTETDAVIFRFIKNERNFFVSKNYADHDYSKIITDRLLQKLKSNGQKPLWFFDTSDPKGPAIYHARMVYHRDTGEEIGMFAYKINTAKFFSLFNDFAKSRTQNISLFDLEGNELLSFNYFQGDYESAIHYLLNPAVETGVYMQNFEKDKYYFVLDEIPALNWRVMVTLSTQIMLKDMRMVRTVVISLCLVTLPIWIVLINFLYISIIKPLNRLVSNMKQLEIGNLGVRMESKRRDELGFVFRTFNKMSEEIKNLINRVYKEELAMKDAEIKSLQAQINPHFLYNTLEAIKWKARMSGVDEIDEMVSALSTIIDANLNRSNEKLITIRNEIHYLDNYILLIKKRFGKKIDFSFDVQEEVMNYRIPKLLIQPIVENAVYHGVEMKKGSGIIELKIQAEGDSLVIIVSDDGVGIEEEKRVKLQEILEQVTSSADYLANESSTKIGIINVHKRIRLLFGDRYGLKIESTSGQGTTITLTLPCESAEKTLAAC